MLLQTVTWTILLSVVLHGISAPPLAARYGASIAKAGNSRRRHRQVSLGSGCRTLRDAVTSEASRHAKRHELPLVSRRQACCLLGQSQPNRPVRRLHPSREARPDAGVARMNGPLPRCQPPIAGMRDRRSPHHFRHVSHGLDALGDQPGDACGSKVGDSVASNGEEGRRITFGRLSDLQTPSAASSRPDRIAFTNAW